MTTMTAMYSFHSFTTQNLTPFRPSRPSPSKKKFPSFLSLFFASLSLSIFLQFAHPLNASEVDKAPNQVPNPIIVQYEDPNVPYAEPNTVIQVNTSTISLERSDLPNDTDFDKQWALNNPYSNTTGADIDFLEAHALSRENSPDDPIIIGIIDTTFADIHPDLKNQLWVNKEEIPNNGIDDDDNGYIDDIHGFNFATLNANLSGDDSHGTHVAGIAVAEKNNKIGISGVFPNAKFIALSTSFLIGSGLSVDGILRAQDYIVQLKKRGYNIVAVNASYGSNIYSQSEYNAIKALSDVGILFCTGSGNEGWNLDLERDLNENGFIDPGEDTNGNGTLEAFYPNSYNLPNIISVSSINMYQELAQDSNYGHTEVDIAAPGDTIYSTVKNFKYSNETQDIILNSGTIIKNQWIGHASNIEKDSIRATVYDCGLGYSDDFPAAVKNNIALIKRGDFTFSSKIINAKEAGAIATIIYNNVDETANGIRPWTLDTLVLGKRIEYIPSLSISKADGERLLAALPETATLKPYTQNIYFDQSYNYWSGTSMAAPVVTAAIAFAAHNFPNETMDQRRARILNNVATLPSLSDKVATGGVVNLRKIVDTDEDNLPDWWEIDHFNTLSHNNTQDNDNDGYTNQDEFLNKTNPALVTNKPNFKNKLPINDLQVTGDTLEFNFMANPGYQYTIEKSDALGNSWTSQATYSGVGTAIKATIKDYKPADNTKGFYRLKATQ